MNAAENAHLTEEQKELLWKNLTLPNAQTSSEGLLPFIYYVGALLVLGALGWFMALNWPSGGLLLSIALIYGVLFFSVGYLLCKKGYLLPGGLLVTLAVCMLPLLIFGIEKLIGTWSVESQLALSANRIVIEICTAIAGIFALRYIRFPFLAAPIFIALWALAHDSAILLSGGKDLSWMVQGWITLVFGLIILCTAYLIDLRTKENFSFWGYLFGTLAFWGGMTALVFRADAHWLAYGLVNVILILLGIWFKRTVFVIFGTIGLFSYLGHLAYDVFANSAAFPLILSLLGVVLIAVGVFYQANSAMIQKLFSHIRKK